MNGSPVVLWPPAVAWSRGLSAMERSRARGTLGVVVEPPRRPDETTNVGAGAHRPRLAADDHRDVAVAYR